MNMIPKVQFPTNISVGPLVRGVAHLSELFFVAGPSNSSCDILQSEAFPFSTIQIPGHSSGLLYPSQAASEKMSAPFCVIPMTSLRRHRLTLPLVYNSTKLPISEDPRRILLTTDQEYGPGEATESRGIVCSWPGSMSYSNASVVDSPVKAE